MSAIEFKVSDNWVRHSNPRSNYNSCIYWKGASAAYFRSHMAAWVFAKCVCASVSTLGPVCVVLCCCRAPVASHSSGFQFPHYSFAGNQMDLHEYKCISASSSPPRSFPLSLARTNRRRRPHEPPWYPVNAILNCLSEHCLESVRAVKQPESGERCLQS